MQVSSWTPSIMAIDGRRGWPLLGRRETRGVEQLAWTQEPEDALMRRAGESVARLALAVATGSDRQVWVAAGPGGNGGDGLYAAARLQQHGARVTTTLCCAEEAYRGPAQRALRAAQESGVKIETSATMPMPTRDRFHVVIDALLGIGTSRAPDGGVAATIRALNQQPCPVLSIDVPSGLNADTGATFGSAAVFATHTLSLLTLKPGLFTGMGKQCAGSVWLDSLGFAHSWPTPFDEIRPESKPVCLTALPHAAAVLPKRLHHHHKGSFGDVLVLGGAAGMAGAAHLAAQACLAAGPGRTFLWLLDDAGACGHPSRPEILTLPPGWRAGSGQLKGRTVICGCGGGTAVRTALPEVLAHAGRLVLDADALNALAEDASLQSLTRGRNRRGLATVITPHPLEAARLLNVTTEAVQTDRLAAVTQLADQLACAVVLKGSGTVTTGMGQGSTYVNSTGGPALAVGGSGDVLAGWMGGLWGQCPAQSSESQFATDLAAAAVWWHGKAADELGPWPIRGLDLIESLRRTVASAT